MSNIRFLLLPFSWIFAGIAALRNYFFDKGILKSTSYNLPVISVGNITVGGTGKTPFAEYLIGRFSETASCALLSRGYGRETKGVVVAGNSSTFSDIGDEPMQMKMKFPNLAVVVAEKRTLGMETLLNQPNPPEIVIMDDAYQHRYVKPGFSVLIMDYFRPVWKDFCLPAGNLRESKKGIKRADVIIINKCPANLTPDEAQSIKEKLNPENKQSLFFTSINYKEPVSLTGKSDKTFRQVVESKKTPLVAVAGIGNPEPFFEMAKKFGAPVKTFRFRDHHKFNIDDFNKIISDEMPLIITTEKDAVRIKAIRELNPQLANSIWYVPIELDFLFNDKNLFDKKIDNYVTKN